MRSKKHQLDPEARKRALCCIPVHSPHVTAEILENREVLLRYHVEIKPFFSGIYKMFSGKTASISQRKLQLDTLGSQTWEMIDGTSTVEEIIVRFQAKHQLDYREAEVAITTFLRQLGQRGLIAMREG